MRLAHRNRIVNEQDPGFVPGSFSLWTGSLWPKAATDVGPGLIQAARSANDPKQTSPLRQIYVRYGNYDSHPITLRRSDCSNN